jgi:hypothetical protein
MEQPHHLIRDRVNTRHIRPLVHVAGETGPGEVLQHGLTTMFFRDDVIDMKREVGDSLQELAILTASVGALDDLTLQLS